MLHKSMYNFCLKHATAKDPCQRTGMNVMAKDSKGRKFNRIPKHDRVQNGKVVHVKAYVRNNRCDCKGKSN